MSSSCSQDDSTSPMWLLGSTCHSRRSRPIHKARHGRQHTLAEPSARLSALLRAARLKPASLPHLSYLPRFPGCILSDFQAQNRSRWSAILVASHHEKAGIREADAHVIYRTWQRRKRFQYRFATLPVQVEAQHAAQLLLIVAAAHQNQTVARGNRAAIGSRLRQMAYQLPIWGFVCIAPTFAA